MGLPLETEKKIRQRKINEALFKESQNKLFPSPHLQLTSERNTVGGGSWENYDFVVILCLLSGKIAGGGCTRQALLCQVVAPRFPWAACPMPIPAAVSIPIPVFIIPIPIIVLIPILISILTPFLSVFRLHPYSHSHPSTHSHLYPQPHSHLSFSRTYAPLRHLSTSLPTLHTNVPLGQRHRFSAGSLLPAST